MMVHLLICSRSTLAHHRLDFQGEDEYTALLHFITNAEKMKPSDEDDDDDEDVVHKRVWYMPWKAREIRGAGRVPAEWLETDMQQGLTGGEADSRLKRVGPNELSAAKENQFKKVLGYFRGPILYCMEAAVALAGGLQDWVDFGVIIGILASLSLR
jgi:H+-transporting ATPase